MGPYLSKTNSKLSKKELKWSSSKLCMNKILNLNDATISICKTNCKFTTFHLHYFSFIFFLKRSGGLGKVWFYTCVVGTNSIEMMPQKCNE
jgi:hypothetical protein